MKSKRVLAIILGLMMVGILAGCGGSGQAAGTAYTMTVTDGDTYEATVLPVSTIDGAYAWNMMGITSSTITLTIDGDNYTYTALDKTVDDEDDGMYYRKEWTWKGTCSTEGDHVTLNAPETVHIDNRLGSTYAEYQDLWGETAIYTQDDERGAAALERWEGATAIISEDGSLSFEE